MVFVWETKEASRIWQSKYMKDLNIEGEIVTRKYWLGTLIQSSEVNTS